VGIAEVDVADDGPEVVALGVEEGLADFPGAVAGVVDVGELVAAQIEDRSRAVLRPDVDALNGRGLAKTSKLLVADNAAPGTWEAAQPWEVMA
jgi:hypothetical protein